MKIYKFKVATFVIWALLILFFSVNPVTASESSRGSLFPGFEHIVAYSIFSLLLFFVLFDHKIKHLFIATLLVSFVYGFGIEIIQSILPWRDFSFSDSMFNLIGSSSIILLKPYSLIVK